MLEYSAEALDESAVAFRRIESFLHRAIENMGRNPEPAISTGFADAMNDDLAVPQGLAQIAEEMRLGNVALSQGDMSQLESSVQTIRGASMFSDAILMIRHLVEQ